jgi:hypothetical protein
MDIYLTQKNNKKLCELFDIEYQELDYEPIKHLGEKLPPESHPMYGTSHTLESRLKIKKARSKQVINHSEETRRKIGDVHRGKIISEEHRKLVIESNKRRVGETRSAYKNKGIKQPKAECPHCHMVGGKGAIYRWHNDNCKMKVVI